MKPADQSGSHWTNWVGEEGGVVPSALSLQEEALARDRDMETSARIQRTLLAGRYDFSIPGIEIAAETLPSLRVDGDFYDFFPLSGSSLDFMLGDVMGKGIPAALTAAATKSAVYRSVMRRMVSCAGDHSEASLPDPADILAEVDRVISGELMDMGKFLTMYYCRVDPPSSCLRFVDAGHTSFLYCPAGEKNVWSVKGANMPLGFASDQDWRCFTLPVARGDTLFFYSDGISEAENAQTGIFGEERLRQLILSHATLPPEDLVKKVLALTFYYCDGGFRDDVTALALRMGDCGMPPLFERTYAIERHKSNGTALLRGAFIDDCARLYGEAPRKRIQSLSLALVEGVGNILKYTGGPASASWKLTEKRVSIELDCTSEDFDWFSAPEPAMTGYPAQGYGSWIMSGASDSLLLLRGLKDESRILLSKDLP